MILLHSLSPGSIVKDDEMTSKASSGSHTDRYIRYLLV